MRGLPTRRRVALAALLLVCLLAAPTAARASGSPGSPSLAICAAENGNSNTCQGAWLFQSASGDSCGANLMYDTQTGQYDAVWIDNEVPASYSWNGAHGRVGMTLCEAWGLGRAQSRIFIGCYIGFGGQPCAGFDGAGTINCCENMAEWYPYHSGETRKPWTALGSCSTALTGQVNGFITQQDFGWENQAPPYGVGQDSDDPTGGDNDSDWGHDPPTGGEASAEWSYALGCATAYDEPMGTF